MSFGKIQVIKMLRDQNPALGLKEAKDIVDSYEVKNFEEKVVRALGEDARNELYTWARLWASKRGMRYVEETPLKSYEGRTDDWSYMSDCSCDGCTDYRSDNWIPDPDGIEGYEDDSDYEPF